MPVSKEDLQEVFESGDQARISLALYELAGIVAGSVNALSLDVSDLRNDIYLHLTKQQNKYKPDKGEAFSYFFKIGEREAWRLCERERLAGAVQGSGAAQHLGGRPTKDLIPLTSNVLDDSLPEHEVRNSLKILDRTIRKARDGIRGLDAEEHGYTYLLTGITWLQEFRRSLAGNYYPMRLPSCHYSKDRLTRGN